jgi:hypothetical protein
MKQFTITNIFEHPINQNQEFQEVFAEFLTMRRKMRKPATDRAIKLLIVKLVGLAENNIPTAIKIIDQSLVNNWLDFYLLKDENYGNYNAGNQKQVKDL